MLITGVLNACTIYGQREEKKMGEKLALFHLNEKCMLVRERQLKWQAYELKKIHKEANT